MVKNFMELLEGQNCTKSNEYAMLVDTIIAIDPSVDAVLAKAKLKLSRGNTSGAVNSFKDALGVEETASTKTDIELEIASAYYRSGSYRAAHNRGLAIAGKKSAK